MVIFGCKRQKFLKDICMPVGSGHLILFFEVLIDWKHILESFMIAFSIHMQMAA